MTGGLARCAALLTLYGAGVAWLTWPLAAHLGTHLPAAGAATTYDLLAIVWALAHESQVLVSGLTGLPSGSIYHPAPHALFYCETAFGALPFFAPPFLLTGNPALAINVTLLAPVALTAVALHVVVHRWTGSHAAAFVAAWTLLTARWLLWYWGPTAPNYAVVSYLPLIVFAAATPAPTLPAALRIVPITVLQAITTIYMAVAVFVPLGVLGAARLVRPATRAAGARLLLALGVAVVLTATTLSGHLIIRLENPHLRTQSVWAALPPPPTELPWGLLGREATAVAPIVLPMILAGALALLARGAPAPAGRAFAHGTFWAVAGIVLLLTPVARWYGTPVTLPTAYLPLDLVLRGRERLGVVGLIGLAVLAGMAFAECTRWLERIATTRPIAVVARTVLALALAAVMYRQFVHGSTNPARDLRPLPARYPIVEAIAPDAPLVRLLRQTTGPVLELPIAAEGVPWPPWNAAAMYRAIFHRRPLLNGYNSYWPAGFPERVALASRLPDREALGRLRSDTGLTTVVVHLDLLRDPQRAPWLALAAVPDAPWRLVARAGDDLVFAFAP